jgi:hypothetical protein
MRFIPVKTEARQVALSVHRLGVQFMNTRVMKTGEGLLCSALACRRGVAVGGDWVLRAIWKPGLLGTFLSGGVSRLITMAMIGKHPSDATLREKVGERDRNREAD